MADFAALQKRVGEINIANGWREGGLAEPGTRERVHQDIVELALVDTEIAEGIEEVRNGKPDLYFTGGNTVLMGGDGESYIVPDDFWLDLDGKPRKPEGIRSEVADAVIRLMDMADKRGWPLEEDIALKLGYNETRGYRHGGKTA